VIAKVKVKNLKPLTIRKTLARVGETSNYASIAAKVMPQTNALSVTNVAVMDIPLKIVPAVDCRAHQELLRKRLLRRSQMILLLWNSPSVMKIPIDELVP
jgi:hypothetical protein